jgi:flagellar M-ring protein FliF
MNSPSQLTQQLHQLWESMSPVRRVGMVAVLLAAMAVVLGVGYWASQPDYRVLYTGLSADDAAAITAKLQGQGTPYRLEASGTTVLVPAEHIQQARVSLAAEGLPQKGGKGFELFDQSPLGMTPFTQQVNYLRALQAELARTITQIEPIEAARVHIVRPDPTPFLREQKPTTASVMVRLKTGASLPRQVSAGVIALVARSVEGLARENVAIIDANGRVLSGDHDPETGQIGSQLEYRRELENYLSARAESMLAPVVGPGRAMVRVTADVNFQRHREKKETYQPDGRVATKEIVTTSKTTGGGGSGPRGPAGTTANLGKGAASMGLAAGGQNSTDESIQTDYVVSKTTEEFEDKMGSVERLTVAALVDLESEDKDGNKQMAMALADVEEIVKKAVGFKTGRDDIKVTSVRLNSPGADLAPDAEWVGVQRWQTIADLVRQASLGIAALAALGMGWMALRRLAPSSPSRPPVAEPQAPAQSPMLDRLTQTALQDPEALARVLAKWLDQERNERPKIAA